MYKSYWTCKPYMKHKHLLLDSMINAFYFYFFCISIKTFIDLFIDLFG